MLPFIITTIILMTLTAVITFLETRSFYIYRFADWYRENVAKLSASTTEQDMLTMGEAKNIENTLSVKHFKMRWGNLAQTDPAIIPERVTNTLCGRSGFLLVPALNEIIYTARWLGYDLVLIEHDVPPPPEIQEPTPSNIRKELKECLAAEKRVTRKEYYFHSSM
jgi:hypothetical protein